MKAKFHIIYGITILILSGLLALAYLSWYPWQRMAKVENPLKVTELPKPHYHADLKVIALGTAYNFNQERFFPPEDQEDPNVHFHKPDTDVVHVHANGITWGYFFESIGGKLTQDCLTLPDLPVSCSNSSGGEGNRLQFFVNGVQVNRLDDHVISDLERVLVYFGPRQASLVPLTLVTEKACIFSEYCPKPAGWVETPEGCTTGEICE